MIMREIYEQSRESSVGDQFFYHNVEFGSEIEKGN